MKLVNPLRFTGLFGLLLLVANPTLSAKRPQSLWTQAIVVPILIEAEPIEGATPRADVEAVAKRLSESATGEAGRRLLKERIAVTVETTPPAAVVLSGTIRLPLSLPPRVIGLRAHDRQGAFATAHFTLRDAGGKVITEETAMLKWDEVRWLRGGGHYRRNRALDEVLQDTARSATARAVKRLSQKLNEKPSTP